MDNKTIEKSPLEVDLESESNVPSSSSSTVTEDEFDPWAVVEVEDNSEKWSDMTTKAKILRVLLNTVKILVVLGCLYLFICSLDLLSSSFRLLSGKSAGAIFQSESVATNPVVGLMAGVLVTVLVQSSSTSTSIVVSMVGAGIIDVSMAIPIIMGANIGTSMTNTIVSFTQITDPNVFRRAFAGATVHDMFNWLAVLVLFPFEIITKSIFGLGYLEWITGLMTSGVVTSSGAEQISLLSAITDPLVDRIIQLDSKVLEGWALNDTEYQNVTSMIKRCVDKTLNETVSHCEPPFIFENTAMEDWGVGLILLFFSLFLLCGCLICMVKVLNSMMKGHVANIIKRVINAKIPYAPWLTGYFAILVGAVVTFLVQSSSVFTSTLTPLVGMGVITLKRVYPLTLGSNLGTTTTSLLAALAAPPEKLHDTLQISLCHMMFNVTAILLYYPIPFMRLPIPMAKFLGNETAKYRWFAVVYLVGMFFVLPGIVLGLSVAGTVALLCVLIPFAALLAIIFIIKMFQRKCPARLPSVMRDWKWLPEPMRSLAPYDRQFSRCACCKKCRPDSQPTRNEEPETVSVTLEIADEVDIKTKE